MSLALKLHHRQRLKRNRRFYWGRDLGKEPKRLARVVNTKKPCSCIMCGNARKHSGPPRQERRFAMALSEV
jgi:hypothetical protein